jgi:hypothetical protein
VAGLGIRLFTDEMISPRLAEALCLRGYDAESCEVAGRSRQQISDEAQLAYATQEGRAILTFNTTDFYRIDSDWKARNRTHHGIIVSSEIREFGLLLRSVRRHLDRYAPSEQTNVLLWLDTHTAS